MKTKFWVISTTMLLFLSGIMIFRPVPIPEEKDCLIITGSVMEITEDGTKDVAFKLAGEDRIFYVNRGLERGLELEKLRAELIGKEITIKYPSYWTPLGNSSKHISKIESSGTTIFSEVD